MRRGFMLSIIMFSIILSFSPISKVTVVVVVRVDNNLFHYYFGVYHDDFQSVLARRDGEGGIEPTEVVEHLVATGQLATVPESAQSEATAWRQRL